MTQGFFILDQQPSNTYDEPLFAGIERACEQFPDKAALIYLGERYSYRKLKELIDRFAAGLAGLDVKAGDRVMLYIPNTPQFVIAYLGAQKAGAVPVPVSPIYTPHEIRYLINDSGAETIVCLDTNIGYVREVFTETCLKRIIVTTYVDLLPMYKQLTGRLFDKVPHGTVEKAQEVYPFKKVLSAAESAAPSIDIDPRTHPCYILYTGGTTGFPKGCLSTHTGMVSFVSEIRSLTEGHISDGNDVLIMVNPLFHQLAQGVLFGMGLARGNTTVLMPIPEVDPILEAIRRYDVTLFLGAPTLYRMILENDRLPYYDLSSLKYCWSGGDVLPLEVFNRWKKKTGLSIYQLFGATEVGFVAMSPLDGEPEPKSVGVPIPSRKTRIVDQQTLEELEPDQPGELLITSEYIHTAYWNKPEETAESYVELEGAIWYRMKDVVRKDAKGQLYYVDRSADVIKYKGYRISCSEIESILQNHPAVIGACVVGVPDDKVGERIKAMVVLKEDARGVGGTELTQWCRESLAPYKVPNYIEFRDMLPKSKVGKLLRRELRDEERQRQQDGKKEITC